jgi:hypothetical protein
MQLYVLIGDPNYNNLKMPFIDQHHKHPIVAITLRPRSGGCWYPITLEEEKV